MPWTVAWIVFLLVGAVAIVAAKRLDDAERRRWAQERASSRPDQT